MCKRIQNDIADMRENLLWQRMITLSFDNIAQQYYTQETAQPRQLCPDPGLRAFDNSSILSGLWTLDSFKFCRFLTRLAFSSWPSNPHFLSGSGPGISCYCRGSCSKLTEACENVHSHRPHSFLPTHRVQRRDRLTPSSRVPFNPNIQAQFPRR